MSTAKNGNTVKVHYTGKHQDGSEFDTSKEAEPLEFTIGKGHVIAGFENTVIGMCVGETKSVKIPANEAYGERKEDMVVRVEKSKFPPHITPELGLHIQLTQPGGSIINMLVADITDSEIVLDANHPFAGKDLNFEIQLVEICK